jgi:hypothetical protein
VVWDVARIGAYAGVVVLLITVFFITTGSTGFRLSDETRSRFSVTPATTVSKFYRHFVAGLLHENLLHIGFNLLVFTTGFWLASQRMNPFATVTLAYATGILAVFLSHLLVVIPLAKLGVPYATQSMDRELVGFSVIAYATLGAGLHVLPRMWQLVAAGGVVVFEIGAGFFVTAQFITVYHLVGFGLGYYLRTLIPAATAAS